MRQRSEVGVSFSGSFFGTLVSVLTLPRFRAGGYPKSTDSWVFKIPRPGLLGRAPGFFGEYRWTLDKLRAQRSGESEGCQRPPVLLSGERVVWGF